MGLMIGVPAAGLALTPAVKGKDFPETLVGNVDDFTEGTFKKVVIRPGNQDDPAAYVRELVAFVRKNPSGFKDELTGTRDEFTIISNICAHLGCPVQENGGNFVCPCHGGAYGSNGEVTGGPPVRPLDRFSYDVKGGELWVTGLYSLTTDGDKAKFRGPGQHSSGPEKYFYSVQP
jgi:Rieske Fe-S protein